VTAVDEHPREAREVIGRREQSRMARNAAHAGRRRIMNGNGVGRELPRARRRNEETIGIARREKARAGHAKRSKDVPLAVDIERQPGRAADDFAEHREVLVAVDVARPRRRQQPLVDEHLHRRPPARPPVSEIEVGPES